MPAISIIVPVYKVEDYLDDCVESILAQTIRDFELILVDDGSPDNCGKMCDDWARKDGRIKVIHKSNGGLSSARNKGLDIATGEYVGFVDSDDTIHPQMYEMLYYYAKKDGSDIVSQQKVATIDKKVYDYEADGAERVIVSAEEVLKCFHGKYYNLLWMTAPTKLFHRNVFSQIRFREDIIYEDTDLFPQMVFNAHQITIIPQKIYTYRWRPDSIMRSDFSPKRYMILDIWQRHVTFFHQLNLVSSRDYFAIVYLYDLLRFYRKTYSQYPELKGAFRPYIGAYKKFRPFIRKHCRLSRLQRVVLEIFPTMPGVALKLYNRLDK